MNSNNMYPNDLGIELVNILYKNTNLSYNLCSQNIIEIFEHLALKLPALDELTDSLVKSIKNTMAHTYNPDALNLIENLKNLSDLKNDLENGNTNFYEVQTDIDDTLNILTRISVKSCSAIYKNALENNREYILNIVDIWKLCTNKNNKHSILRLLCDYFTADCRLTDVLLDSTSLVEEVFYMLDESLKTNDCESVEVLSMFLVYMFCNVKKLSINFKELLAKEHSLIQTILSCLENEVYHAREVRCLDEKIISHCQVDTLDNLLICILISINCHFVMPSDNILLNILLKPANHDNLFNKIIQLFNYEDEPLKQFKMHASSTNESFGVNSTMKFLSDLFSQPYASNMFYSSDFNLIIDVLVRQLSNLSSDDQIRMEYLSLIDLIFKNSDYFEKNYRIEELKQCFKNIINEKIETYDQDIVRVLYSLFPNLRS